MNELKSSQVGNQNEIVDEKVNEKEFGDEFGGKSHTFLINDK